MKIDTLEKGLIMLTESFPNRAFNAEFIWQMLKDMDDEPFIKSILKICNEKQELYPNTNIVAVIRDNAIDCRAILAGEAFEMVMDKISSVGSYGIPKFETKLISRTVDAMGWKSLCMSNIDDVNIVRSQLMKIYDSMVEREKSDLMSQSSNAMIQDMIKKIVDNNKT